MECVKCGKKIRDNLKFCPYCGKKVNLNLPNVPIPVKETPPVVKTTNEEIRQRNLADAKNSFLKNLNLLLSGYKKNLVNNSTFYWLDDMSDKQIANIINKFQGTITRNDIVAFIDTSIRDSGKAGMVFLRSGISYVEFMQDPFFVRYDEINSCYASKRERWDIITEIIITTDQRDYVLSTTFINLRILLYILRELVNHLNNKKKGIQTVIKPFDQSDIGLQKFSLMHSKLFNLETVKFEDLYFGLKEDLKISRTKVEAFISDYFKLDQEEINALIYAIERNDDENELYVQLEQYFNDWKELKSEMRRQKSMYHKYVEFKELETRTENLLGKIDGCVTYVGGHPDISKQGFANLELYDGVLKISVGMLSSVGKVKVDDIQMIRFESKQEFTSRITLTRVVLLGALGLFLKKVESYDCYVLTIECKDYIVCFTDSSFSCLQGVYKHLYDYWKGYEEVKMNRRNYYLKSN